ncbi:MAG: hypothetical protein PVF74_09780 [Anaerolineales bacterium]|jgi:hypothetical protein
MNSKLYIIVNVRTDNVIALKHRGYAEVCEVTMRMAQQRQLSVRLQEVDVDGNPIVRQPASSLTDRMVSHPYPLFPYQTPFLTHFLYLLITYWRSPIG